MPIDAAMLSVASRELNDSLNGARVEKINMPTRDEVLLLLRTREERLKLLVSAHSGGARVHITKEELDSPATPPGFCMLLRKYLTSARITGFRTIDGERLVFIDFDATSETFERIHLTLSVELLGRYCNIVLINSDTKTVIDALKRITSEDSDKRQLYPGCDFTLPPPQQGKHSFLSTSDSEIAELVKEVHRPLSGALLEKVAGLSPLLCREIAYRTDKSDPDADAMNGEQLAALKNALARVRQAALGDGVCFNIAYDGERAIEFSFVPLLQYEGCKTEVFETFGELCDRFYAEKDRAERARSRSQDLSRQVNQLRDRAARKQQARLQEKDNSELAAQKRLYGELINANLHDIPKGAKSAELLNYYTGETVKVPLDPTRSAAQNAQKYFKSYRKLVTASKMLEELLKQGESELKYLESVSFELGLARTEEDFAVIRKELTDAGFLRGRKAKEQKQKRRASDVLKYRTTNGFNILVGKNNIANDRLTLKTADKHDIWLHVKDIAGAHVIMECEGREPDDGSLEQAAKIAALHSSADSGSLVAVDITEVRQVRKPAGARAGMVIYDGQKTVYVRPDAAEIEKLAIK